MKNHQIAALVSFLAFWSVLLIANIINSKYYNLDFIKDNNWAEVFIVFCAIVIVAIVASQIMLRKGSFVTKFLNYFSVLCSVVTVVLAINWIYFINKIYEQHAITVNKFIEQAESDIKNDSVKYFSQGLVLPPKNEFSQARELAVQKTIISYGLIRKDLGCLISPEITEGKEKYNQITDAYLEIRNGKNWKEEMNNKIDSIRDLN